MPLKLLKLILLKTGCSQTLGSMDTEDVDKTFVDNIQNRSS
jgi:hypothetical protein